MKQSKQVRTNLGKPLVGDGSQTKTQISIQSINNDKHSKKANVVKQKQVKQRDTHKGKTFKIKQKKNRKIESKEENSSWDVFLAVVDCSFISM